jgi:hypothetical protein
MVGLETGLDQVDRPSEGLTAVWLYGKLMGMKKENPAKDTDRKLLYSIDLVKTTMRLPRELWNETRVQALYDRRNAQDLVAEALELYLKTKAKREGGR